LPQLLCKCVISSSILPQPLHCQLTGSAHTSQFDVDTKRVPHALHDHLLVKKAANLLVLTISIFSNFHLLYSPWHTFVHCNDIADGYACQITNAIELACALQRSNRITHVKRTKVTNVICKMLVIRFKHYRQVPTLCHYLFALHC
jgi:hypothetical protein